MDKVRDHGKYKGKEKSMSHDDWESLGDGWHINSRSDGTMLVWHEDWGGNKNRDHYHLVERGWSHKPTREQLKALRSEIEANR
jgi:hypothetical protein